MLKNSIAIIPARAGSKGIIDKNIKTLNGFHLIAYSIAAAYASGIKRVLVSTDSKKYADISKKYGADVPYIRPSSISNDKSTDIEFMNHAINWYQENKPSELPEYWIHLRPTTPLRDPKVMIKAMETMFNNHKATSLRSAHEVAESPFKWFLKDRNGFFKGLREDLTSEKVNNPRQSFPKMYIPNGYIDIVCSSHILKNKNLHGSRMLVYDTPRCTEVDNLEDFKYLKYEIENKYSPLLEWLKARG